MTTRRWLARLRDDGFAVANALPHGSYFEHHVKLVLSGEGEAAAVRALAVPYTAHVSRNAGGPQVVETPARV
ncbi:hypothetical protein [Streptomyces sp. NPDC001480]|uniref:hypothetical protein n=1 Tax=Streptomyces sp. NPDC001480 TaxID=3364577 RepID=UPI0036951C21